jgi:uncharacterized protein
MPLRLAADSSLGFLTRRLRIMGYDVVMASGARLEEVFELAARDGRTVITPSHRRPPRFAAIAAITVPRDDPAAAVRMVVAAGDAGGRPFGRCAACNTPLRPRTPFEAMGEVPSRVLRSARELCDCPGCGRWYWDGSHVARLRAWVARALGPPPTGVG